MPTAKKPRLQVTISRLVASKDQLERLQKLSAKRKEKPKDEDKKQSGFKLSSRDTPGSLLQIERESPVRHRLSNLLDGTVLSPDRDNAEHPTEGEENVTSINYENDKSNAAELLPNPESVKANLFDLGSISSLDDGSLPVMHDEGYITVRCYPDVEAKTRLQVEGNENESSSANISSTTDANVPSGLEGEISGNGGSEQHDEIHKQLSNDVAGLVVPECNASLSYDVTGSDPPSGDLLPVNEEPAPSLGGVEAKKESELTGDSGSGLMPSAAENSSIDYATDYSTLEVCTCTLVIFV